MVHDMYRIFYAVTGTHFSGAYSRIAQEMYGYVTVAPHGAWENASNCLVPSALLT